MKAVEGKKNGVVDGKRRALLAMAHIAPKELGIEEDYRDILEREFGVRSAGDLENKELGRLINLFESWGWKGKKGKKGKKREGDEHRTSNIERPTSNEGGEKMHCVECVAFVEVKKEVIGICGNERSGHFGHVISFMHPGCEQIVITKARRDESTKGG